MRLAVIQHAMRPAPAQDLEALLVATARAAESGAEVIVIPGVPALDEGPLAEDLWRRLEETAPGITTIAAGCEEPDDGCGGTVEVAPLGRVLTLTGDVCIEPGALAAFAKGAPDVAVLAPRSESELQAQAVFELAIGLSTSLAPLVVIAEPDGAEIGDPGHGGSAVVYLGEVLGEAMSGDDLLLVDIVLPIAPPEPRDSIPLVPPVLAQRVGAHRGVRVAVDYPADLG